MDTALASMLHGASDYASPAGESVWRCMAFSPKSAGLVLILAFRQKFRVLLSALHLREDVVCGVDSSHRCVADILKLDVLFVGADFSSISCTCRDGRSVGGWGCALTILARHDAMKGVCIVYIVLVIESVAAMLRVNVDDDHVVGSTSLSQSRRSCVIVPMKSGLQSWLR